MSLRRNLPVLGRFLVLALLMVAVPACKKPVDPAPHMKKGIPGPDAPGVSFFPLMVLEFDKEIDGSTINANIEIWTTDAFGVPNAKWGGSWIFHHLVNSFQIVIENTQTFIASTEYAVVVFNGLLSSKGDPINGGMALRFTTASSGNSTKPSFSVPAQNVGAGTAGQVVLTWTQATEGGPISANYEFYEATTTDSEDFFDNPPFFSSSQTSGDTIPASKGLVTGTTHFFRVICRDSQGNIRVTAELSVVVD